MEEKPSFLDEFPKKHPNFPLWISLASLIVSLILMAIRLAIQA